MKGKLGLHKQFSFVRNKTLKRKHSTVLHIEGRTIVVDLELTWQYSLSVFRPKQTKGVCINQVDLSLWASMAVSMIMSST